MKGPERPSPEGPQRPGRDPLTAPGTGPGRSYWEELGRPGRDPLTAPGTGPGRSCWEELERHGRDPLTAPGTDTERAYWEELERPGPDAVTVQGTELRAGSRVRLHPRAGADVFDLVLAGRAAVIEAIETDMEGNVQLAVIVEDDPGRDLGERRQPGHRFFFTPEEVQPLPPLAPPDGATSRRVLVAGIGNVFLGDDGFGIALAGRLARRALGQNVDVVDFGIRGMDLAYAMQDGYDDVLLLDATPRGDAPGTLYVIEPEPGEDDGPVAVETHAMDPVKVLALVRALGGRVPHTLVVGCEPQTAISADDGTLLVELSAPVHAALDEAVRLVESLLAQLTSRHETEVSRP